MIRFELSLVLLKQFSSLFIGTFSDLIALKNNRKLYSNSDQVLGDDHLTINLLKVHAKTFSEEILTGDSVISQYGSTNRLQH